MNSHRVGKPRNSLNCSIECLPTYWQYINRKECLIGDEHNFSTAVYWEIYVGNSPMLWWWLILMDKNISQVVGLETLTWWPWCSYSVQVTTRTVAMKEKTKNVWWELKHKVNTTENWSDKWLCSKFLLCQRLSPIGLWVDIYLPTTLSIYR